MNALYLVALVLLALSLTATKADITCEVVNGAFAYSFVVRLRIRLLVCLLFLLLLLLFFCLLQVLMALHVHVWCVLFELLQSLDALWMT